MASLPVSSRLSRLFEDSSLGVDVIYCKFLLGKKGKKQDQSVISFRSMCFKVFLEIILMCLF